MRYAALLVFLSAASPAADFDIATFIAPSGWKVESARDHVVFTHIDPSARNYCMIGVYKSRPGSGDPAREFSTEWADIVQRSFTAGPAPGSSAGATSTGLRYVEGGAMVRTGNSSAWAQLLTFPAGDRVASVLLVATDRNALSAREQAIRGFLDSLSLSGAAAALPASVPAPAAPEAAQKSEAPKGGIVGVWMGFRPVALRSWEIVPRWYSFFEDGQVYKDIPRGGLIGFDRNSSRTDPNQRDYWGTWTYQNGSGVITRPGVKFAEQLRLESAALLVIDHDRFSRCASVDGLRLEGAWTSYGDPNDPSIERLPPGARPVFHFTRGGTFVDEGVFASFLRGFGSNPNGTGGSGTYEIKDFTLTLRYSDGRIQRTALTGLLGGDPAVRNDILFIGRGRFNKRR